jgi:hypothetical protein
MRCSCCDKKLSDYETTLKHAVTGMYLDTCIDCLSEIASDVPMPVKGRKDLIADMDIQERLDRDDEPLYNNSRVDYEDD